MFGFTLTRRHRAELDAARAESARLRKQRDNAVAERDTAVFNRRQVVRQNAELDAANRRLQGRLLELGRRIGTLTEADPEYAARLEWRIAMARKAAARILAAYGAEQKRANRLQDRPDSALGLDSPAIAAGANWQERRHDKGPFAKEMGL